jgi:hypothetical protein
MKLCIINTETKVCENIVSANSIEDFVPYKTGIEAIADEFGEIGYIWVDNGWVDPNNTPPSDEILELSARTKRNNLLKQTVDSINPLRWESMSQEQKEAWLEYRQALLDIPQQEEFPRNIIWPVKPV